jgi:hypothetical protein
MSKNRNDKQAEGPLSKVGSALFWFAVLALAVFLFPWWP